MSVPPAFGPAAASVGYDDSQKWDQHGGNDSVRETGTLLEPRAQAGADPHQMPPCTVGRREGGACTVYVLPVGWNKNGFPLSELRTQGRPR